MQFTVESSFFIDQVKGEGPCHKIKVEFPLIFSKIPWVISEFLEFPFKNGAVHKFSKTKAKEKLLSSNKVHNATGLFYLSQSVKKHIFKLG